MHPKVQAALQFLGMMHDKERGRQGFDGGPKIDGERLSKEEEAARRAALEMLRNYFAGEIDFPDSPNGGTPPGPGNAPLVQPSIL